MQKQYHQVQQKAMRQIEAIVSRLTLHNPMINISKLYYGDSPNIESEDTSNSAPDLAESLIFDIR